MTDRSSEDDSALVKAFLAGKKGSFDLLVLRHKNKVFNLCHKLLGDYNEADDAAQETFVKVYRSLKKFRFESTFSTWLYRIAVNTCKNKLKSSAYRHGKKTVALDNPGTDQRGTHSIEISDETLSPGVELEKKETAILIQKAIESLPAKQRAVVVLRDIEGLAYDEIARITGHNLGTVKSKLSRARLDLRKKLAGVV